MAGARLTRTQIDELAYMVRHCMASLLDDLAERPEDFSCVLADADPVLVREAVNRWATRFPGRWTDIRLEPDPRWTDVRLAPRPVHVAGGTS